jgi:hypothetical protein
MSKEIIPADQIALRIRQFCGEKVLLDFDLAALYGVETRVLNQAVKRNTDRFPSDFMFQLSKEEAEMISGIVIAPAQRHNVLNSSQIVMSSGKYRGKRYCPYAFTEQGVAMLSSVMNSDRFGERTRLACWRWRHRHRELSSNPRRSRPAIPFSNCFSARHRKEHARRVCSPA